jgi:DNA repair protein SbcC/Rad50
LPLEKMLLENVQRFERLEVEFSPGITCILGESDKGKSSLLRALRWICLNKPRGDSIIRWGEKLCRVRAKWDGHKIKRERNGSTNVYQLDKKEPFKAFRDEVPPDIQDVLRLSSYNFQSQQDPIFWFNLSPPELARELNKLVDLELIDTVMSRLDSRKRGLGSERGVVEQRLQEAQDRIQATVRVPEMDKRLTVLETTSKDLEYLQDTYKNLSNLVRQIKEKRQQVEKAKIVLVRGNTLVKIGKTVSDLRAKYNSLSDLVTEIRCLKKKVKKKVPDLSGITTIVEGYRKLQKRRDDLFVLIGNVKTYQEDLLELKGDLTKAKTKLKEESKGICPICGGELEDE